MGGSMSCPDGFEQGVMFTCLAKCPGQFKNVGEECKHVTKNRSFRLNALPMIEPGNPVPSTFENEYKRVQEESAKLQQQMDATDVLLKEKDEHVQNYSKVQSQYSSFKESTSAGRELREVKDSLKPFRPPTAPSSDLEKERKAITADARRNLYFLQIALFLVVLVMLSYLVLPISYANPISFLLLCVGIALGFFLKG
jgi:hypothetical protein